MEAKYNLLRFGRTINDLSDRLPKGRRDCFDVGIWGGCGIECPVFVRGECENPGDLEEDVRKMDIEDINELKEYYDCFKNIL